MPSERNGKVYVCIPVLPKDKERLEIMKRRMGEDFGDMYRPHTRFLMKEGERMFGHLPEWKQIEV